MGLVELDGRSVLWLPDSMYPNATFALQTSTYLMDASTELAALVFRWPRDGNIDRLAAIIAAVGNTPNNGLRMSIQDVSLTNGLPDGTVDENATIAQASVVTGWLESGALSASRAVTRGGLASIVNDFPSWVTPDSVTVQGMNFNGNQVGFPYGISVVSSKPNSSIPQIFFRYDDGIWASAHPLVLPFTSVSQVSMNTGTTPDEAGVAFKVPGIVALRQVYAQLIVAAAANFDVLLYGPDDSVIDTLVAHDGDVTASTSGRHYFFYTTQDRALLPGLTYRLIIKAQAAAANVQVVYGVTPSQMFDECWGGTDYYMTARTNGGSWTNYNNGTDGYRKPGIHLGFGQVANHGRARLMVGV